MQGIYVAFSIHNLSVMCLAAFLIFTDSIYLKYWKHQQANDSLWLKYLCVTMTCAMSILCISAIFLQVKYSKRHYLVFTNMTRFFIHSVFTHLLFFIIPLVLRIIDLFDDPSLLSLELWSFINLVTASVSLWHIRKVENKVQTIDFLFFADDAI